MKIVFIAKTEYYFYTSVYQLYNVSFISEIGVNNPYVTLSILNKVITTGGLRLIEKLPLGQAIC